MVILAMGDYLGVEAYLVVGGESVRDMIKKLNAGVHVVVGTCNVHFIRFMHLGIRERGSVLYLGMAKEISKYHTDAPAGKRPKKLLPPKPSMQTE